MSAASRIVKYEVSDVIRSRWLLGYTGFFLLATEGLLRFGGDPARALVDLTNVVLLVIPLVTIVFGTMYLYSAREFIELLLAQPVGRPQLFAGLYLGLTLPLSGGFVAGVGIPFAVRPLTGANGGTLLALLAVGVALTFAFTGLAFVIALRCDDRVKGLGIAIAAWAVMAIVYDALVLVLATMFANYPLERPMLALMVANPIDLGRIVLLLRFDISALMGYTGAVFKQFFGTGSGMAVAAAALLGWIAVPALLGARTFRRKDF
jgi:Cu-processing system permease protein